jgi:inner membrane protein
LASILHVAVGMLAGRLLAGRRSVAAMALGAGLSLLPDADVVAFAVGIPYEAPFGHRGASHSLAFALTIGLGAALITRRKRPLRTGLIVTATVASHGTLDMLTDGGLGVALLWPVDEARHFWPWRPIPVSPIGPNFISARGAKVALAELGPSIPLVIASLWPARAQPKPES